MRRDTDAVDEEKEGLLARSMSGPTRDTEHGTTSNAQPACPANSGCSPGLQQEAASGSSPSSTHPLHPQPMLVIPTASASSQGPSVVAEKGGASPTLPRSTSTDSASESGSLPSSKSSKEQALCRICLEEDSLPNLEAPCGCTGTQKYAHHDCIQRWIDEKGHLRCEICEQNYTGEYTVPPPGPAMDDLTMFSPMFIRVENGEVAGHHDHSLDFLDESDHYYQRNPAASWCFTFVIFIMFLVVLHHTMLVTDGMEVDEDGSSASPSGSSSSPPADDYATSLTLFLFWIGTKAFLIGIPLYTVMRIAARQARREQYEAMLRSGAFDAAAHSMLVRVRMRSQDAGAAGAATSSSGLATTRPGTGLAPVGTV